MISFLIIFHFLFRKDQSLILKDLLLQNKQILYSACGIVKATYIQLLKTLCWESAENMLELTDLLTLCYSEVKVFYLPDVYVALFLSKPVQNSCQELEYCKSISIRRLQFSWIYSFVYVHRFFFFCEYFFFG